MYLRFYGFHQYPFSITPDPAFLYLSPQHREALGHLLYGTGEHGGFVQLTGEVGTGKTTLIRTLLEQDHPDLDVALCLNPRLTVDEFVAEVCDELGADRPEGEAATLKSLVDALNAHLLETHTAGRRTVLIVDEAQNLSRDVLEQLRLLTNLETHTHKLMRIILVGQPELETVLRRPDLRQLAQRITARYHLRALTRAETTAYVRHRLQVAGGQTDVFTDGACRAVYTTAGGVPRLVNTVCERALMGGYSQGRRRIDARMIHRAAREALPGNGPWQAPRWTGAAVPAAALLAAVAVGFGLHYGIDRLAFATEPATAGADPAADSTPPDGDAVAVEPVATAEPDTGRASADNSGEAAAEDAGPPVVAAADMEAGPSAADAEGNSAEASAEAEGDAAEQTEVASEGESEAEPEPLPEGDATINQLLRMWGVFGEPVDSSCWQLAVGDLRCVRISGGVRDLERYNRPALVEIETEDGDVRYVLLSSLKEDSATLVFGDGTRDISRARLERLWTGDARIIWRQPIGVRNVESGSVGSAVVWVRRQLARRDGVNLENQAGRPSPIYDEALAEQVRRFQRDNGLEVDGVVGPRTMLALNNREPEPGTPFLFRPEGDD